MSGKEVVEVIYGKNNKYEVVKETAMISDPKYHIYKDGKYYRGSFSSLRDAVEAAQKEG